MSDLLRNFTGFPSWIRTAPTPLSEASVSITTGLLGSKCVSCVALAIASLMLLNSCSMSLGHTKFTSFFNKPRIMYVFFDKFGMKVAMKLTVLRKLCSSCLLLGGCSFRIALTFWGHGSTPFGEITLPKYSIFCFLI